MHDGPVTVDPDGRDRSHAGRHRQGLDEEDDRAHGRREDPPAQQGLGERERHAEDGHEKVCHGQVDQETTEVGLGAAARAGGKDDDDQDVAHDGQGSRGRVESRQEGVRGR